MKNKICSICKLAKPLTEFNFKNKKLNKLQSCCKDCQRQKEKDYYNEHKQKDREKTLLSKKKHRQKILAFLEDIKKDGCCLCGEKDVSCIDFHHLYDKEFNLACSPSYSMAKIKCEVSKCILLCANCHRKLHAGHIKLIEY